MARLPQGKWTHSSPGCHGSRSEAAKTVSSLPLARRTQGLPRPWPCPSRTGPPRGYPARRPRASVQTNLYKRFVWHFMYVHAFGLAFGRSGSIPRLPTAVCARHAPAGCGTGAGAGATAQHEREELRQACLKMLADPPRPSREDATADLKPVRHVGVPSDFSRRFRLRDVLAWTDATNHARRLVRARQCDGLLWKGASARRGVSLTRRRPRIECRHMTRHTSIRRGRVDGFNG
jgi:hypothetical protein